MAMRKDDQEYRYLLQTIYAHFWRESTAVQQGIAWVIKNRLQYNRPEWGGHTIVGACRTFACWKNGNVKVTMNHSKARASIEAWLPTIFTRPDPTGKAVMYHNPVWPLTNMKPKPSEEFILSAKINYWNFYRIKRILQDASQKPDHDNPLIKLESSIIVNPVSKSVFEGKDILDNVTFTYPELRKKKPATISKRCSDVIRLIVLSTFES